MDDIKKESATYDAPETDQLMTQELSERYDRRILHHIKDFCPRGHDFSIVGRYPNGRCRACNSIEVKEFNRKKILEAKVILGSQCNCPKCKETSLLFLEFDHIHNDGFKDNYKSANASARYIINNPGQNRLQLLCSNCNHGKRMNAGVCPHLGISSNFTLPERVKLGGYRPTDQFCVHGHDFSIAGRKLNGQCVRCAAECAFINNRKATIAAQLILGSRCNCPGCDVTESLFLTFDHIRNDRSSEVHKMCGAAVARYIISNPTQTRYQLLCMNCNHGKRMNNGICPHLTKGF